MKTSSPVPHQLVLDRQARYGPFRVFAWSDHAVLLGDDDRHLDFRVKAAAAAPDGSIAITTRVRSHHAGGRLYFAVVRPFHGRIVKAMAARMRRRVEVMGRERAAAGLGSSASASR